MGVEYAVACRKCNVKRELDKLRIPEVENYEDAESAFADVHPYRPMLLASFMKEHYGHDCVLLNDTDDTDEYYSIPDEERCFFKCDELLD